MSPLKRTNTLDLAKKIFKYFFQGLVVIAPVGITLYVVLWLFNTVDNILPGIIHTFFPSLVGTTPAGELRKIPGLGFIVVLLIVTFIGRVSSLFFVSRIVEILDKILQKTPGIKFIYSPVKDFFEAFTGNKKKFDKPVLVSVDAINVWRIGFITSESALLLNMPAHVIVYIPHSYAISGITYIVPKEKIIPLKNVSSAEVMKFVISAGVAEFTIVSP